MKLSIIIPAYNEKDTILKVIEEVQKVDLGEIEKEIILVDDASVDGTVELIKNIKEKNVIKIYHEKNRGKGGAVKSGIKKATGEIIIIQDADLEYNPNDYPELIKPIIENKAKVVYGSRILHKDYNYSYFYFMIGGRVVSLITNLLFFSRLTDEPTCYKTFRSDVIKRIKIKNNKFGWEPEVTAKILKKRIKIVEVPVRYYPRDKKHGKKITWKDGLEAIWLLIKHRISD